MQMRRPPSTRGYRRLVASGREPAIQSTVTDSVSISVRFSLRQRTRRLDDRPRVTEIAIRVEAEPGRHFRPPASAQRTRRTSSSHRSSWRAPLYAFDADDGVELPRGSSTRVCARCIRRSGLALVRGRASGAAHRVGSPRTGSASLRRADGTGARRTGDGLLGLRLAAVPPSCTGSSS